MWEGDQEIGGKSSGPEYKQNKIWQEDEHEFLKYFGTG